jgi:hypothetical protein
MTTVDPSPCGPGRTGRTRRPLPVLVAALSVAAIYLLVEFSQTAATTIYGWLSSRGSDSLAQLAPISVFALQADIATVVVLAIVFFLFAWGITPIHGNLRFGQALGRGILTSVVVGIVVAIVTAIRYVAFVFNPPVAEQYRTVPRATDILRGLGESGVESVTTFAHTAAIVVLGAVILWNWMRRPQQPDAGLTATP